MVLKDFDLKSRFETERNRGYLKNTCYITVNIHCKRKRFHSSFFIHSLEYLGKVIVKLLLFLD